MKVLDSKSLHAGIDELLTNVKLQINQIKEIEIAAKDFTDMEDSFKGKAGTSIRAFYQECHLPFLSLYSTTLKNYERFLNNLKKSSSELESDPNGFISQSFLDFDLPNGLNNLEMDTSGLIDEAKSAMNKVSDIVYVPKLDDQTFHTHVHRAKREITQTIEDLGMFDRTQTKEIDSVDQDIQLMRSYVSELKGMINVENFNFNQVKYSPTFTKLNNELFEKKILSFGDMITHPFDYINKQMSWGDNLLVGYQAASTVITLAASSKLKVHYFGSKPTLWEKIRGKYEFTVKMDPSWTSKGKHSDNRAKRILDFSRTSTPSNPIMKSLHKFVKSYKSPSHLYKHVAGFPKNFDRLSGTELIKGTADRMKTGTKELVGKVVKKNGLTNVGKRIPFLGNVISAVSNLGELTDPKNSKKSFSEKLGRATFGFGTDMVAIGAGVQLGATIGSIGGPVGVVVGGAVGGLVGGLASSKFGGKVKNIGGELFKDTSEIVEKTSGKIIDIGKDMKKSIGSWFN